MAEYQPITAREYCARIADFLVENPGAWCKGALAQDDSGVYVTDARDTKAVAFCAMGLLERFVPLGVRSACADLLRRVVSPFFADSSAVSIVYYNDRVQTTLEDVISMFRMASRIPERLIAVDDAAGGSELGATLQALVDTQLKLAELAEKNNTQPPDWLMLASAAPNTADHESDRQPWAAFFKNAAVAA